MILELRETAFKCPSCSADVRLALVTAASTMLTAQAQSIHDGVGHTLALVGTRWVVRCQRPKMAHLVDLVAGADKVLRQPTVERPAAKR